MASKIRQSWDRVPDLLLPGCMPFGQVLQALSFSSPLENGNNAYLMALVRPNKKAQGLLMILPSHTGTWLEGCIVSPKAVHIGIKQEPRKPDPLPFPWYQRAPGSTAGRTYTEPGHIGTTQGFGTRDLEWVGGSSPRSHSKQATAWSESGCLFPPQQGRRLGLRAGGNTAGPSLWSQTRCRALVWPVTSLCLIFLSCRVRTCQGTFRRIMQLRWTKHHSRVLGKR